MTVARILDQKGRNVFTVEATAPLQQVIDMLASHKVGVVVVTGSGGEIAGILSERDVIAALSNSASAAMSMTAADVMTRNVATCTADESESAVMERMDAMGVRHLPVFARGQLSGIVSLRDVIRLRLEKIEEMMRSVEAEAKLLA